MALQRWHNRMPTGRTARIRLWTGPLAALGGIEVLAFVARFWGLGAYRPLIYDEYYYVPAADILIGHKPPVRVAHMVYGIDPNLLSHPPFAKELIALSLLLFGNHPWAWRLPGALLGSLVPLAVFWLAWMLFKSRTVALAAAGLSAVDGLMITISRVALPDSVAFPFVVLNMALLWRAVERLRHGGRLSRWFWLGWGTSLGLGLAAKWIGGQTIVASWLFVLVNFRTLKQSGSQIWGVLAALTAVPLGVYFATYFYAWPSGFHQSWLPQNVLLAFVQLQWRMFHAMWGLTFYHPWTSDARSWLLLPRPTALLIITTAHHKIRMMAFSNPVLVWAGAASLAGAAAVAVIRRRERQVWGFLVIWMLAFYGTWLLTPRAKFTYYFASAMPAVILAAVAVGWRAWHSRRRLVRLAARAEAGAVLASTVWLLPLWVGMKLPTPFYQRLWWPAAWNPIPRPGGSASASASPTVFPSASRQIGAVTVPGYSPAPPSGSGVPVPWSQLDGVPTHNSVFTGAVLALGRAVRLAGPVVDQPTVVGGTVYAGTNTDRVEAVDWATGRIQWSDQVPNMVMTSPVTTSGAVVVGLGNQTFRAFTRQHGWIRGTGTNGLMAFDRLTGRELWFFPTRGEDMATPAVAGGVVYDVTGGGRLIAVNAATGKLEWSLALGGFDSMSSPLIWNGSLYVATNVYRQAYPAARSTVYAIDLARRQIRWARDLPVASGLSDSSPATDGQRLYITGVPSIVTRSGKNYLTNAAFGLSLATGRVIWQTRLAGGSMGLDQEESGNPSVVGGRVYVGDPAGRAVYALDAGSGRVVWRARVPGGATASPLVAGGVTWVVDRSGSLVALNARSGKVLAVRDLHVGAFGPATPVFVRGGLLVAGLTGWLATVPVHEYTGSR